MALTIKDLIPGKWYRSKSWPTNIWAKLEYISFKSNNIRYHYSERFWYDRYAKKSGEYWKIFPYINTIIWMSVCFHVVRKSVTIP